LLILAADCARTQVDDGPTELAVRVMDLAAAYECRINDIIRSVTRCALQVGHLKTPPNVVYLHGMEFRWVCACVRAWCSDQLLMPCSCCVRPPRKLRLSLRALGAAQAGAARRPGWLLRATCSTASRAASDSDPRCQQPPLSLLYMLCCRYGEAALGAANFWWPGAVPPK